MINKCSLCPRKCGGERLEREGRGVCKSGSMPKVARAAVHMWEEPAISGTRGSGTVFFSGCPLSCVFCQNQKISHENFGKHITPARLREIFFELIDAGVHNINLVNPTHFADGVLSALDGGLPVPIVYNSSGYERIETLRRFEGKVQIYLPDLKYACASLAAKYSHAPDYFEVATRAVLEMFRQIGPYESDDSGILTRGVVIRHLILPNNLENTYRIIDWVEKTFNPGDIIFSLMSQFTPVGENLPPELSRTITSDEYERALDYLMRSQIVDGFYQEPTSAGDAFIPDFDLSGV